jgi:Na+-transporting methylmalonyl-CoA/oxaloacetate decarboxylase gamma subunit
MTKSRSFSDQRGETQMGVIIGALVLGVLVFIMYTLGGCIEEHKDSKVEANQERQARKDQREMEKKMQRGRGGYSVTLKPE